MMDYEVFKNVAVARIKEFLPPVYSGFDVDVIMVPKINGMREAMTISFEAEGCRISGPNIYLDEMYEAFSECKDIDMILQKTAGFVLDFTATQKIDKNDNFFLEEARDYVVQMVINTEMNRELLKTAPHREFFDLSVIYRLAVPDPDGKGCSTALITYDMLEGMGITADEVDALAEANSRRSLPTEVFHIGPYLSMMTTGSKIYGAINLLRLDEIKKLADEQGSNLYLLPSSVHDLMVLKESEQFKEEDILEIVRTGNEECNKRDEHLSNSIYYYDRTKHRLELRCSRAVGQ